ncbi:MAG: peroxiredoxin [Christiangramia sp.]|uniref:peroxiredoxin n=1 Tax=Christiangramia sp. TaxID=1931228 RepID=UPI0032424E7C
METGDHIPEIRLKDQRGEDFQLQQLIGKPAVIYFYPKNFTPGCTKEACNFRDSYQDFQDLGAEVVGISSDSESSHQKFAGKLNLPFILLSDSDKKARKSFGVKSSLLGMLPGRETFVFDGEGKLLHRFNSMNAQRHMPEALAVLKKDRR